MLSNIKKITNWSIENPKKTIWFNILIAVVLLFMVALPFISSSSSLNRVNIDTDPENMLSSSEPVRVFHNQMRKEFNLYDIVVLGITNEADNIFNKDSLEKIYDLTEYAKTLNGVIVKEIIAPSTVDSIEASSPGVVNFNWLMNTPPTNDKDAQNIYNLAKRIPFLNGTLVSEDGKAIAIYIPIKSKDLSYKVASSLKEKAKELNFTDNVYITGLPVAQDQFGIEMFKQMAISAPIAMLLIFSLMFLFFKNISLIISPMVVAILSVIITMGLLIVTGNTIHIMSSMIPIFIMPIAVLDAVHILSDFYDNYHKYKNAKETIHAVMDELFTPMLYTSITTVVGFASLALTPIPPVQVFGIFIALGVMFAWLSTVTFIPAYIMLIKKDKLKNFGLKKEEHDNSIIANILHTFGNLVVRHSKTVVLITVLLAIFSFYGVSKININDNPVKWFKKQHEIRIADKELNKRFAGTYMAYLSLDTSISIDDIYNMVKKEGFPNDAIKGNTKQEIINNLYDFADSQDNETWYEKIEKLEHYSQVFKNPEALKYIDQLQEYLSKTGYVGKSNSIVDIVKTVHRDLYEANEDYFSIPKTFPAISQTLITYQNSHRPNDLWHFVNPDFTKSNIWIQLKSGDNQDMQKVIDAVDTFQKNNKAPFNIEAKWYGMTYINVIWQNKMVNGMIKSFLGSFLVVLLLMTLLFRSIAWGTLAMLPLTITIALIYGIIGFVGKDYDMPIAVLSSLSLGLAIDYAIHFLARAKEIHKDYKNWEDAVYPLFGEPARAIFRNVIIISIGFLPLVFAPLVPYQTVGIFISAILFFAGAVSLAVLPAVMTIFSRKLFTDVNSISLITKISVIVIIMFIIIQNFLI